jgi:SAM-dependent methyltransferase
MKSHTDQHALRWPAVPNFPADAFKGTAAYYAEYRPPYPEELLSDLLPDARVHDDAWLLDLGCGPGHVTLVLVPHFSQTWAVDPEREMIDEGQRRTPSDLKDRVCWICSSAEALDVESGRFHVVTIGEAFHRMDQRLVAARAREWLVPGGRIAILGYKHMWHGTEDWKRAVCDVLTHYRERQPSDVPSQAGSESVMTFDDVLRATGYRDVVRREYHQSRVWDADEVIGYLYSVSIYSKRALGDRTAAFEHDIRRALYTSHPSGQYTECAMFECLSATTPVS